MTKCVEIGTVLDYLTKKDVAMLYKEENKCSKGNLLSYDSEKWLNERPTELVCLSRTLCGSPNESFKVAKAVEFFYGCRNSKIVLPLSFQENIVLYSLSRNKTLVASAAKMNPSGSYDYLSKWMTEQASEAVSFPSWCVRAVSDNEQCTGRTHKVKAQHWVPMSIVTSHIYINFNQQCAAQKDALLSPKARSI